MFARRWAFVILHEQNMQSSASATVRQSPKPADVGNSRRTSNPQPRATGWRPIHLVQKERASHPAARSCRSQCGIALCIRVYDLDSVRNTKVLLWVTNSQSRWRPCTGSRGLESGPTPDPLSLCQDEITNLIVTFAFSKAKKTTAWRVISASVTQTTSSRGVIAIIPMAKMGDIST